MGTPPPRPDVGQICWRVHGATTGRLRNLYIHIMMLVTHIRAAQLLLGGLLLVQFAIRGVQSGTFGGSVFIGGLWDLEQGVDGELDNPLSRCEQAVDEAGACSSRMVTCRSRPSRKKSLVYNQNAASLLSFTHAVHYFARTLRRCDRTDQALVRAHRVLVGRGSDGPTGGL